MSLFLWSARTVPQADAMSPLRRGTFQLEEGEPTLH